MLTSDIYNSLFELYNQQNNKFFYQKCAQELCLLALPHLNQSQNKKSLELGAGSGFSGEQFIHFFPKMNWTFLEPNKKMHAEGIKLQLPGQWVNATAENTPFSDGLFDAIFSNISFHWFDFLKSLNEMKRIQKNKAPVFLSLPLLNPHSQTEGSLLLKKMLLKNKHTLTRSNTQGFSEKKINSYFQKNALVLDQKKIKHPEHFKNAHEFLLTLLARGSLHAIFGEPLTLQECHALIHESVALYPKNRVIDFEWSILLIALIF